jgi:uncharacterized small protein (DUF1192 family)
MIGGTDPSALPYKKRKHETPETPENPQKAIGWCGNRHERSADIELLPVNERFTVRHANYGVYGRVVATIGGTASYVVLWNNGLVEWLGMRELRKHKAYHENGVIERSGSFVLQRLLRYSLGRLDARTSAWVAEHKRIKAKLAKEEDFLDGAEFAWR